MDESTRKTSEPVTLKEFLETVPPGRPASVSDGLQQVSNQFYDLNSNDIEVHCDKEKCGGVRTFAKLTGKQLFSKNSCPLHLYVRYQCRNCMSNTKLYALVVDGLDDGWVFHKLGEIPDFGAPTPSKLITLIADERDNYLKGRQSENQGLGIGAFSYYRLVVENQKHKILNDVIRAAKKVNAAESMIRRLEAAKKERQFTKAIETIKPGVPHALLINGQNPLTLLHFALSEGMHAGTDEEYLRLATTIRIVLTELVSRIDTITTDLVDLNASVAKLMDVQAKKKAKLATASK